MTADEGVIQVYAASEAEGNNINRYNASGVCEGQDLNAAVLTSIETIAANYDNFVRVERYTMSAAAVDMSKYELLV